MKRKKKTELQKAKAKLWKAVREYIRERDGHCCTTCYKCGLEGANWQVGHFIPSSVGGLALRYDENNLGIQCYYCNINLGGWGERYAEVLEKKHGKRFVTNLRKKMNDITKWDLDDYENKTEEYKRKLDMLPMQEDSEDIESV